MIIQITENFNTKSNISCPSCNSPHVSNHGSYNRNVIDYLDGEVVESKLSIKRVKCKSCEQTHSIIPNTIIPHKQYSLNFILAALKDLFFGVKIHMIIHKFKISFQLLYKWKKLFILYFKESRFVMNSDSILTFLKQADAYFFSAFFCYFKRSFMQFIQSD